MLEVPIGLRRTAHLAETTWLDSARQLIDLVCRECGLDDLSTTSVLDIGCGTKITKALLDDGIPIHRYVGIDVDPEVIDFLGANVDDSHFEYHHIDVQNDLYNPNGRPLADRSELPVGDAKFDVIWLFSVFTHLGPGDYAEMLRLLRRYIRDDGWLVFSLFINEVTDTGYGPLDWRAHPHVPNENAEIAIARALDDATAEKGEAWFAAQLREWWDRLDEKERAEVEEQWSRQTSASEPSDVSHEAPVAPPPDDRPPTFLDESGVFRSEGEPPDYVELFPETPLLAPLYSRRHATELFDGSGWQIASLNPPRPDFIQHHFVCRPA